MIGAKYHVYKDSLILSYHSKSKIIKYDEFGKIEEILLVHNYLTESDNMIFYNDNFNIYTMNLQIKQSNLVCCTKSKISCFEIANKFHVVAYGTYDCHIHFVSMSNGCEIKDFELNGKLADSIIITESWGFIVCKTDSHLFIFNVNGALIHRIKTDNYGTISSWFQFSSLSGFDYICIKNEENYFGVFEVMYPDEIKFFLESKNVRGIFYSKYLKSFMVIGNTNELSFIPYELPDYQNFDI